MALYIPLALLFTWPLVARFSTQLAGDHGDSWQNLWNIGWIGRSLWHLKNPFYTHDLWHPSGTTLVFQTFDLPDAIWSAPLIPLIGLKATYNLVVLGTYIFSGWSMFLLGRGLGASRPAAFFAGAAYTFSTYHFGHALGHLHILAMQWVPLFVLAWWRVLETRGWRWAAAGGLFLALSALSSWYYLLNSFLIALGISIVWLIHTRGRDLLGALPRIGALCGVFLVIVGPLMWAMIRTKAAEPVEGQHSAAWFSADLQSFIFPNAAQELAQFSQRHRSWPGNAAETTTYLGAILVLLVLVGLVLRAPRVGSYLIVALIGITLSLGPRLLWGGQPVGLWTMPYTWVERSVPLLQFMGVPVRFAFCATFGLAAALGPALDAISARWRWWVAAPLAMLAVAEHKPHAFVTSNFPVPPPVAQWSQDRSDFAVLDACRDMRPLWHQLHHQHPIVGGYLTRTPKRLEDSLKHDPIAGPLFAWEPPTRTAPFATDTLDLSFDQPVVEGAENDKFSLDLTGELRVGKATRATFTVESDDGSELFVDGRRVVDNRGAHAARTVSGIIDLAEGTHKLTIRYQQLDGDAVLRAWWEPAGESLRFLGASEVEGGFRGTVRFRRRELSVSREEGLNHLRDLRIRYVIQMRGDSRYPMETQLGLAPFYEGAGLRIYEVPARDEAQR
jgi:hypothetical protein